MGKEKAGFLTPKAISNRIKSKGLQKLKWYCQMCNKQCRDENGYKCHTASESHHRQMKLFMEDGQKFISNYSGEFLKGFLDILRRQFGGKRVRANMIYQEYIKDKEHIHMNATRWSTLTGLSLWLGKQGICKVDENEKGIFIEYIDKDPEAEQRRAAHDRLEKTEDEENRRFLEKQIQSLREKRSGEKDGKELQPLVRESDEPLKLSYSKSHIEEKPSTSKSKDSSASKKTNPLLDAEMKAKVSKLLSKSLAGSKRSALEEIREEEEQFKERKNRRPYWMSPGIEVKLINNQLPDNILYRRATVIKMVNNYTAVVQVIRGSGTKLKVDQDHVQTTLPTVGDKLKCVNGAYRGDIARLKEVHQDRGVCDLVIDSGLCKGREVMDVSLDDVCKMSKDNPPLVN
ncbi:hypothetical protein Ciccas_005381 [Cichlidogyrus casuarinus]|uniref:DNA/RNA-binding protein Kin17 WH-like domain-containing protein n=1 Tax=Cichlidogyrus casuarinus TaxID=1844966 RepID=A0ABD2Q984_9PLAT